MGKAYILTTWINYFVEWKNATRKSVLPLKYQNIIAGYI